MRIAYFSPLPPQRSGITDYSLELLPFLTQLADVTLFVNEPEAIDERVLNKYQVQSNDQFIHDHDQYDLALYHIGNSEYHDDITRLAMEFPGAIVLHDFNLHHAVAKRTLGKEDVFAYVREVGYEQGVSGIQKALAFRQGFGTPIFGSPLNGRLLDTSLGVIVHSQYAANLVRGQGYRGPLAVIPALITPLAGRSRRADLNLAEDVLLFGSFGLITKEKQVDSVLRALEKLRGEMPNVHYLLVGRTMPDVPVDELVCDLGLEDLVHPIGYVEDLSEFIDWIHTSDVVINLRNPTVAETSAVALRALAAGKALIVDDHGWYREIPPEAALKITPGSEDALLEAMRLTGQSKSLRESLGKAGLRFTRESCHPENVAEFYYIELQRILKTVEIYG
ncbi:MAG: glycosyltransferase family 4 protein [Candidatus Promineifilaceae bacterium]